PPLERLDSRINPALHAVQRPGRIVRALHVVQLNLVVLPAIARSRRPEQHSAVVMPHVPDVHLHLEIAIFLVRGEMPEAVRMQDRSERLELRLAVGDAPLREILRTVIEGRPLDLPRQLAYAKIAEPDRIGEGLEPEISRPQPVTQLGNALDVE